MTTSLEEIKPDAQVLGLLGKEALRIVSAQMMGDAAGQVVFRSQAAKLELVTGGRKWRFEEDWNLFRLVAESKRIRLAWLFESYVAESSNTLGLLRHHISGMYEHTLSRHLLRHKYPVRCQATGSITGTHR